MEAVMDRLSTYHWTNIGGQLTTLRNAYDSVIQYLATRTHQGNTRDIYMSNIAAVGLSVWHPWCEEQADNIMEGVPDTEESREFRTRMISSMKQMRFGNTQQCAELVELECHVDAASQCIFAFCAVGCLDRDSNEVNVIVSGFGKKWRERQGQHLESEFWENCDRQSEVRSYLRYGALDAVRQQLHGPAPALVQQEITSQQHGGGGGSPFHTVLKPNMSPITAVICFSGKYVDSLQFQFADGTFSEKYGGGGGVRQTWNVPAGCHITGAQVKTGRFVDNIQFFPSAGPPSPVFGGDGGSFRDLLAAPEGHALTGVTGRACKFVDAIAFRWGPIRR